MDPPPPRTRKPQASTDASVQGTNDDASVSKLSAVNLGYVEDPYLSHFVRGAARRAPLINRGYYARMSAMRRIALAFLASGGTSPDQKQVLSLGAGFDTLYFWLQERGVAPRAYCEVDFAEVTSRKAAVIDAVPTLRSCMHTPAGADQPSISPQKGTIHAKGYSLVPADIRDAAMVERAVFGDAGLDRSLPTLVLSECVLVYLPPKESAAIVGWVASAFEAAAMVIYEQIGPDDAFGRQMLQNLEVRGCPLLGLHATPTLAAHEARLTRAGFERASALEMATIYSEWLDKADLKRAERLELFDEFEEFHLLMRHYCIALGTKGVPDLSL